MYTSHHHAGPQAAGYGSYSLYYPAHSLHGIPPNYPSNSPSEPVHPSAPGIYPDPRQPYSFRPPITATVPQLPQYHPPTDGKVERVRRPASKLVPSKNQVQGIGNCESDNEKLAKSDKLQREESLSRRQHADLFDEDVNRGEPLRNMPDYAQAQTHYPNESPYYPPPPSYSNPTSGAYLPSETWNAQSYPHHFDTNTFHSATLNPYIAAPYLHTSMKPELSLERVDKKRPRSVLYLNNAHYHAPLKERKSFHSQSMNRRPSPPPYQASKSVRRKKKMYSDFVGVTYNKTHAKYQACITHYRKQHYLGRYKLAVDAALAYDESARLLKGTSWKVNFPTMQAYDEAKLKELESIGKKEATSVDVAGSLAAVAMKVEAIASNMGHSGRISRGVGNGEFCSSHHSELVQFGSYYVENDLSLKKEKNGSIVLPGECERRISPRPCPLLAARSAPAMMTKVTPSPTFNITSLSQQHKSPPASSKIGGSLQSPLTVSPNPTRHTMGTESSTPDSVIRPTVLTYQGNKSQKVECCLPPDHPQAASGDHPSGIETLESCRSEANNEKKVVILCSPLQPDSKSLSSPLVGSPKAAPPVIQNGTLAAASALMTLFGIENSCTD